MDLRNVIVLRLNLSKYFRELNSYKKVPSFCKLFLYTLVDQVVHHFLFISDEHIVKQSKTSILQNTIYK